MILRFILSITFLLILFHASVKAQPYIPILNNTSWHCQRLVFNNNPVNPFWLTFKGDSIINNLTYKKYESSLSPGYFTLLREDTSLRKVFFINQTTGQESILYDFNLVVGNQITLDNWGTPVTFSVQSITTVSTLAGPRKKYDFYNSNLSIGFSVYEGMGSDHGPLSVFPFIQDDFVLTICSYQDSLQTFHYGGLDSCPPLPIVSNPSSIFKIQEENEFSITPNPNKGSFLINTGNSGFDYCQISIFDSKGKKIWQGMVAGDAQINLPFKPENGLYFLILRDNTNHIRTSRLVIGE